MSDLIRSNFEPGRWLLVSGVILSVVLMLQLYAINETVDVSSIDSMLGDNYMGLFLVASYLLTMIAMITVVVEYFSVKKKVDGLLALTEVLDIIEDLQYPAKKTEVEAGETQMPGARSLGPEDDLFEPESLREVRTMDPLEQAYAALDDGESVPEEAPEAIPSGADVHEAVEAQIMEDETGEEVGLPSESSESSGLEPLPEADVIDMQTRQEDVEEDGDEVEGMLQQSEVISTLMELERVVDELKIKKPKAVAT